MSRRPFSHLGVGDKAPEECVVVVEIPKGSHHKYEYDEEREVFTLDRVLHSPLHYPADYGFMPGTRANDGDFLDAIVIGGEPTFTGCVVRTRPIGLMRMYDDGEKDFKILCVQKDNTRLDNIKDLEDLKLYNPHFLKETSHFFREYKLLEEKKVEIKDWGGKDEAMDEIRKAIEKHDKE